MQAKWAACALDRHRTAAARMPLGPAVSAPSLMRAPKLILIPGGWPGPKSLEAAAPQTPRHILGGGSTPE
jgi:hypothetical protein